MTPALTTGYRPTVGATLAAAATRLAAAGVAEAEADAAVLAAHVLGTTRTGLVLAARTPFDADAAARFEALVARRAARVPVHHLVGEREFWSLAFRVDGRVLVPRPETELVVETALRVAPGASRIVDVGTGSGAIAIALARELPSATVVALDVDPDALDVARENGARHAPRIAAVRGDLLAACREASVDVVVSNPPYVATADLAGLAPEVRDHEPRRALDGGPDGLDVVRRLVAEAARALRADGWLVSEIGAGQAEAAGAVVARDGRFVSWWTVDDLAGIPRVLVAERGRGGWTRS
jgi:release factor glutamine methyltransferase